MSTRKPMLQEYTTNDPIYAVPSGSRIILQKLRGSDAKNRIWFASLSVMTIATVLGLIGVLFN